MLSVNFICFTLAYCLFSAVSPSQHKKISFSNYQRHPKLRNLSNLLRQDLEQSVSMAEDQVNKLATFEGNIQSSGLKTEKSSPFYGQMVDYLPTDDAVNHTRDAFVAVKASQHIASKYCFRANIKQKDCVEQLNLISLNGTKLGDSCANVYSKIRCVSSMLYRSADGSCNHEKSRFWGRSNTAYRRLLPAEYDDGLYTIKETSETGKELPSARLISTTITDSKHLPDTSKTQAMTIWGLFIGHDLTHTPASNMVNIKTPIMCCTNDGRPLAPRYNHVSCASISIPHTDIFYSKYYQSCMNYVRSLLAMRSDCNFGPAEQLNQATHFLDGSVLYGSSNNKAQFLRSMWGGRLVTSMQEDGYEYPPLVTDEILCTLMNATKCYNAGDMRVNSNPQLSVLHTMFVREHNRVADQLAMLNAHWSDERLYQEAKKIVTAEIQHITYSSWLPLILGKSYSSNKRILKLLGYGFSNLYDEKIDPTISNEFATAGLPSIHSMIDGNIGLYMENRDMVQEGQFLKHHFGVQTASEHNKYYDNVIRGMATQNSQLIDISFTDAITHYWYSSSGKFGMDLLSLDIQRGRDHGLPSYVKLRKYCNLSEVTSFNDLHGIISEKTLDRLEKVYKRVTDIDLVVGVIAETSTNDAMVGPTLRCIIEEQFERTRAGDRYFYDNEEQAGSFTKNQLEQIRKANLGRIFCDNSNGVGWLQRDIFLIPNNTTNKLLKCQETAIPFINLSSWKEEIVDDKKVYDKK